MANPEAVFFYYDVDGDGKLTREQFLKALQSAGAAPSKPDFEEVVRNYGSTPDQATFERALFSQLEKCPTLDSLGEQFGALSPDGRMDQEVLKYIVTNFGDRLDEKEVEELIKLLEVDETGHFDVRQLADCLLPVMSP